MATINLNPYDYSRIFNLYEDDDGQLYFNLLSDISIDGAIDPNFYTEIFYNSEQNWYDLSFEYYGTTRLWWIILVANNIINPFTDIQTGDRIKILKKNIVTDILAELNNSADE